jgi:hypothetical protein
MDADLSMGDPLDDLIGAIQKGENTPSVPAGPDPVPAVPITVPSNFAFLQVAKDALDTSTDGKLAFYVQDNPVKLDDIDCILLHYKTITSLITGQSYAAQYQLSGWKFELIESPGVSATLGNNSQKERENRVIKLAEAVSQVGRYPNVLFAFEWRDASTGKRFKHTLPKEGHVRG